VGRCSDQTGESLTAGRAGAGTRRVKPKETDQRQPPQGVLWKVELKGGEVRQKLRRLRRTFRSRGKRKQIPVHHRRKAAMQPVRGSKGRSVRQNRNGSNSGAGNNGHSGNRIVTHPEKGTGQHFLNIRRKAVVREGKPVRITVAWLCTTSR
jgi:hypothetical protein